MLRQAAASAISSDLDALAVDTSLNAACAAGANCIDQGHIHARSTARVYGPAPIPKYTLIEQGSLDRSSAEKFIALRFAQGFNARIQAFMPRLFTVRQSDGAICGAFGLRSAQRNLFVEQYLDHAIDKAISSLSGELVNRASIVEVGHLCGAFPGAMRALILLLIERLHREGFEWVAFTGTTQLRNAFHRLGLHPIDLGAARIEAIPSEAHASWGNYYEHEPRVLAGKIGNGLVALRRPHRMQPLGGGSAACVA